MSDFDECVPREGSSRPSDAHTSAARARGEPAARCAQGAIEIDAERQLLLRRIFESAVELDATSRGALVERECDGDADLRRELESLLVAHDHAADWIETSHPANDLTPAAPAEDADQDGRLIGRYRLLHAIGQGGMGVVYLAVCADDTFQKRVALKLLRRGLDSEDLVRRFKTERQILAGLDHPYIAKLLDGGSTADGLPYFVLDYVEGEPIHRWAKQQRASIPELLQVFRRVCSAVHFAHQNLVVHRDLKPGNILVAPDGTPKLLDFGIAKLLNPELSSYPLAPTVIAWRPMTREYASPEQIAGGRITTASDTYSLGVMLYELLTGRHPFRASGQTVEEIEEAIRHRDPARPSATVPQADRALARAPSGHDTATSRQWFAADPKKHRRLLAGDLDHIVLKALRKEPDQRYASTEQLAEDLERYLEGRPVLARQGTVGYRVKKFVRRHRLGVAVAATGLVATLGFGVVMASQRAAIARERDQVELERARAEQVTSFLIELFEGSDPFAEKGPTTDARELLDRAAERIENELDRQPLVRAALMDSLGSIYQSLGVYEPARRLLESALEVRRAELEPEHPHLAQTRHHLGAVLREQGEYEAAELLLRDALTVRLGFTGERRIDLADNYSDLGAVHFERGEYADAEQRFGEAVDLYRELLGPESHEVAGALQNLAASVHKGGDLDRAAQLYRQGLDLSRRMLGDRHPTVASNLANLATLLHVQGKDEEAERLFLEALEIRRETLGIDHPDVANSLYNLADLYADRGQWAAAEPPARASLAILELAVQDHWRVALVESLVGRCLVGLGRYPEAETLLLRSHAALLEERGIDSSSTQESLRRLAALYQEWGRPAKAAQFQAQLIAAP